MPRKIDGFVCALRAYMDDDRLFFRRGADGHFCHFLALRRGLKQPFAGLTADIHAVAAVPVEGVQQMLEWRWSETLLVIERGNNRRQNTSEGATHHSDLSMSHLSSF